MGTSCPLLPRSLLSSMLSLSQAHRFSAQHPYVRHQPLQHTLLTRDLSNSMAGALSVSAILAFMPLLTVSPSSYPPPPPSAAGTSKTTSTGLRHSSPPFPMPSRFLLPPILLVPLSCSRRRLLVELPDQILLQHLHLLLPLLLLLALSPSSRWISQRRMFRLLLRL
jgi:hypothetical protein